MSELRTLYKQSSHYMVGRVAIMALGVVSFPIYTRMFSVADFGIINLVLRVLFFPVAVAKLGMQNSLLRYYEEYSQSSSRLASFYSTVVGGVLIGLLPSLGVALLLLFVTPEAWLSAPLRLALFSGTGLIITRTISPIFLGLMRVEGRTKAFNIADVANKLIALVVVVPAVLFCRATPMSYLVAFSVAEALVLLVIWMVSLQKRPIRAAAFNLDTFRHLLTYGVPLVGAEFLAILLGSADRILIQSFLGSEQVGYFAAAAGLAVYLEEALTTPLGLALVPAYIRVWTTQGKEATTRFLSIVFNYYLVAAIGVCALFTASSRDLMTLLGSAKYAQAHKYLPFLVLGSLIFATNTYASAGLFIYKRTVRSTQVVALSAAVKIALNWLLLERVGLWGAVVGTVAGYTVLVGLTWHQSSSLVPIRVDWPRCGKAAASSALATLMCFLMPGMRPVYAVPVKAVVFTLVYLPVLLLLDGALRRDISRIAGRTPRF